MIQQTITPPTAPLLPEDDDDDDEEVGADFEAGVGANVGPDHRQVPELVSHE